MFRFFTFYKFLSLFIGCFLCACGFRSEPQLAQARYDGFKNKCADLYITDSYALNTNNAVASKRVFKVENLKNSDAIGNYQKNSKSYPVYHSFINNENIVSNIAVNKNFQRKACRDYYLSNIDYLK